MSVGLHNMGPFGGLLVRQGSVPVSVSRQMKKGSACGLEAGREQREGEASQRRRGRLPTSLSIVGARDSSFAGELVVSTDSEGRSCGSRDFDQYCRISPADDVGAIPES